MLLAVILMGGIYSLWGAVVAGLLSGSCPRCSKTGDSPTTLLLLLFGIGVLQVLGNGSWGSRRPGAKGLEEARSARSPAERGGKSDRSGP